MKKRIMDKIFLIVLICLCIFLGCESRTRNSRRFLDGYPIPEEIANYTTEPCEIHQVKGTCVSLPSCREYMKMLEKPETRLEGAEIVKKRDCGRVTFLPKVCCPSYKKNNVTEKTEVTTNKADTK